MTEPARWSVSYMHTSTSLDLPIATRDRRPLRLAARTAPVTLPFLASRAPCVHDVLHALRGPRLDTLEMESHPTRNVGTRDLLGRGPFIVRSSQGGMRGRTGPSGLHRRDRGKADQTIGVWRGAKLRDESGSEVVRLGCGTAVLLRGRNILFDRVCGPFGELSAKLAAAARTRVPRAVRSSCMRGGPRPTSPV